VIPRVSQVFKSVAKSLISGVEGESAFVSGLCFGEKRKQLPWLLRTRPLWKKGRARHEPRDACLEGTVAPPLVEKVGGGRRLPVGSTTRWYNGQRISSLA